MKIRTTAPLLLVGTLASSIGCSSSSNAVCAPGGASILVEIRNPHPVSGATVLHQCADGTYLDRATTDSSGNASLLVHPGDMLTAVSDGPVLPGYEVWTGVRPGETILFGSLAEWTTAGHLSLSLPSYPGASTFSVVVGQAGDYVTSTSSAAVPIEQRFVRADGSFDVVATPWSQYGPSDPQAFIAESGTLVDGAASISASAWRTDWATRPVTLLHVPSTGAGGSVAPLSDGRDFDVDLGTGFAADGTEDAQLVPPSLVHANALLYRGAYADLTSNSPTEVWVVDSSMSPAGMTLDLANALPPIHSMTTAVDPDGRTVITWPDAASYDGADHAEIQFFDTRPAGWQVHVRPGSGSFRTPQLGPDAPTGAGTIDEYAHLYIYDSDRYADYDDYRVRYEADSAMIGPLGHSGRFTSFN